MSSHQFELVLQQDILFAKLVVFFTQLVQLELLHGKRAFKQLQSLLQGSDRHISQTQRVAQKFSNKRERRTFLFSRSEQTPREEQLEVRGFNRQRL